MYCYDPMNGVRKRSPMTQELMKIKMDFAQAAEILKTSLKMKGSPVAVGFATTKDDIPPGIPELDKTIKHCMMVDRKSVV